MKGPSDLKGAIQQVGTALGAVNETPLGFGGLWSDLSSHQGRQPPRETGGARRFQENAGTDNPAVLAQSGKAPGVEVATGPRAGNPHVL